MKDIVLSWHQGHMIVWTKNIGRSWRKGGQRSHNFLGSRRLVKLLSTFFGRMIFLATVTIEWKRIVVVPTRRMTAIRVRRETIIASSRAQTIIAKGVISLGAEERQGGRCTSHNTKSGKENSNVTRSPKRREPQIWDAMEEQIPKSGMLA